MASSLYPFRSGSSSDGRQLVLQRSDSMNTVYANVILDVQARELKDRLFTYRVPDALSTETFIGAQVLVPFGASNLVGGYVVSLQDRTSTAESSIKDIAEVLEPEPLFD